MTRKLIRDVVLEAFDNGFLHPLGDGAILPAVSERIVLTTDGYVVTPLFFPGGDIGRLAVHGTVNDLAVCGASPICLSIAMIVEEGLPMSLFRAVVASIRDAARACNVPVVAGDTKVVPRGAADKLFVTATGIGSLRSGIELGMQRIQQHDAVLVSGYIGDHGIAVLSAREQIDMGAFVRSDTASVYDLVQSLLDSAVDVHFLRDPTRGGVSAVLHEVAEATGLSVVIDETAVPLSEAVRGACELLGIDPLYAANEGKFVAIVAAADAALALECLRRHHGGQHAAIVGHVVQKATSPVLVRGALGVLRVLDEPAGAPLPRIC